jgi:hypothetical protein
MDWLLASPVARVTSYGVAAREKGYRESEQVRTIFRRRSRADSIKVKAQQSLVGGNVRGQHGQI